MKKLILNLCLGIVFLSSALILPTSTKAAVCGTAHYIASCKVSGSSCVESTYSIVNCSDSSGQCMGTIQNAICGWKLNSNGTTTCQVIVGSPSTRSVSCAYIQPTSTSVPPPPGSTSTPSPCTQNCTTTEECKRADNCAGTKGATCGISPVDGITMYICKKTTCTTVCPPPPTSTPTTIPTIIPTPTTLPSPLLISPTTDLACSPISPAPVTFSWTSVPTATSYYLRIDDLSNGWVACGSGTSNPGDYCISNLTSITHTVNLPENKNYAWWVSAFNGTAQGTMSITANFSTVPICLTASCQLLKAYNSSWVAMDLTQLTNTKAGNIINYCATGSASSGYFTKARFTINGVLLPETTLLRPSSSDFCQTYTVSANTYNFNISSELNHITLGWVK